MNYTRYTSPPHHFHIPVLGVAFSIDTPLKVARFGISSVVSIIDDDLIEDMRAYHCSDNGLAYHPIDARLDDCRALRISAYLDMMGDLVARQVEELKAQPFKPGSDLVKYFELLPSDHGSRQRFSRMTEEPDAGRQVLMQEELRQDVVAGSIDVNIMAKVDKQRYSKDGSKLPDEYSDALSALRGFANSKLAASVVISAGYNPRLFNYLTEFSDFFPDEQGLLRKKVILKVSDFRSAMVQGRLLAKKGIWVSEFRVESGLNCGGHAFATEGMLLGPILEEFAEKRLLLLAELLESCNKVLIAAGRSKLQMNPTQRITVQGGIGTAAEQSFLMNRYGLDGTGWGSPFLLVPEATNVDAGTLKLLAQANRDDFFLSDASPLGVPFNNFRRSSSEAQRVARIAAGRPGSPCYKEYLVSNTEFTDRPICTASRNFQYRKLKAITSGAETPEDQFEIQALQAKDCLCEGLTASARLKNDFKIPHRLSAVAICPGPNLAYFSGVFSLSQMVAHIYGRANILNDVCRAHMFINELELYVKYLEQYTGDGVTAARIKSPGTFRRNLLNGIDYYRERQIFEWDSNSLQLLMDLEQRLLGGM